MMGRGLLRIKPLALSISAVALVFITTWAVFDRMEERRRLRRQPDWLTLEASPVAVSGRPYEIRVHLEHLPEPQLIVCGLRWTAADRRVSGGLASAGPARETRGGETIIYRIDVREKEEMRFVSAVIYLSPNGRWRDRTRGASTELIPVISEAEKAAIPPPRSLRMSRTATPAEEAAGESRMAAARGRSAGSLRSLFIVVLLAAGVLCAALAMREGRGAERVAAGRWPVWMGFSVVLLAFAFLEAFDIPARITEALRLISMERDVYDMRRPIQGAAAVTAALGTIALIFFLVRAAMRSRGRGWFVWAGIGLLVYLSVTVVGMISFHPVDVLRRMSLGGVSPFHAARGAGAALALVAAVLSLLRENANGPK